MVLTRDQRASAFDHILDTVLDRGDDSPLKISLKLIGVEDIYALLNLDEATIYDLEYPDPKGDPNDPHNRVSILKSDKNLLDAFMAYDLHLNDTGVDVINYRALTQAEFDIFRISPAYKKQIRPTLSKNSTASNAPAVSQSALPVTSSAPHHSQTLADYFRRGIKKDPSLFPILKDEKHHDTWHRSFMNQARAQDVVDVLDHTYVPASPEDVALFCEKQKYLYAVLESKVLTDHGKAIIRAHEVDFDAQQVYKKLQDHHLKSTKALIDSASILSYITSTRLGDGTWTGTTEGFILHWQNQVRLYEKHVPFTDHFSDGQKKVMLQNAVHNLDDLRQVKTTGEILSVKSGIPLFYDEYCSLLLAAATAYDDQYKPMKTKRHVMAHMIHMDEEADADDPEPFDIDSSIGEIQAYATKFRKPFKPLASFKPSSSVRMPSDKWFSLDDKSKSIWDQLDDKAKSIILGYNSSATVPKLSTFKKPSTFTKTPFKNHANLHEISAFDFLSANLHHLECPPSEEHDLVPDTPNPEPPVDDDNDTRLIHTMKSSSSSHLPPGDIRRVMSKSSKRSVNSARIEYSVSYHKASLASQLSLVDRGANGGVAGDDVRVIFQTSRTVDIKGIDNHHVTDIGIGTVGGVVNTQHGPVIAIMHQYALLGHGSSIHSPCQLEWYKNDVNDKSLLVPGGLQRIQTLEGYILPLVFKDGLARLDIRPYTDAEFEQLPHVFLTSELEWDPTVLDHEFPPDMQWGDAHDPHDLSLRYHFDEYGNYRHRVTVQHVAYFHRQDGTSPDDVIDHCIYSSQLQSYPPLICSTSTTNPLTDDNDSPLNLPIVINKKDPDWHKLRPLFGWMSPDLIKKTFEHSTQYARLPTGTVLKRAFKSPNPALNVSRRSESVACDIVYADVPSISDGSLAAVIFVGTDTQVTDVYGIKTDKQFVNTLEDNIIQRGAPNKLISDSAQVLVSNKVQDILRTLCISNWQSEPYQQHQNAAERRYQTVKATTNRLMDRTGAPSNLWLLCLQYVCFLLNHTYNSNIDGIPLNHLTGNTVDISVLLRFHFYQKVYYKAIDPGFPSDSGENMGFIVGISEHCGHALTWKILTCDTTHIINRSLVRPFDPANPNLRADSLGGEMTSVIKSRSDDDSQSDFSNLISTKEMTEDIVEELTHMPMVHPEDLVGRTFLLDKQKDGQQFRAKIVRLIEDYDASIEDNKDRIKFLLNVTEDQSEEIITYNQLLEYLSKESNNDIVWKFKKIVSHQGPLTKRNPDYKGSSYNVVIEWENGEITSEPLHIIASDDPVTCAIYAKEKGLLNQDGWKQFRGIAKRQKKFTRMVNQAKLKSFNSSPRFKYGFEIPRNYDQAIRLDERNKNSAWRDAINLELNQINEYDTFTDKGHHTKYNASSGYKKIRVHFVFDVKHDGRHKARLVADGHLTDIPVESVYSGVVSLRGFRLVLFLAELNKINIWSTDIGNAYLEAYTSEKVYIIAGPEFQELEGHVLIISKALYGLRSSGARWHDRFSDCVAELGFVPCKAEPDIWMRKNGDIYEYIAVYVDDLAIAMKDPQSFIDILNHKHKFKTKGTGPITFHLGMDFIRENDGTLTISPVKYIEKLIKNYEKLFGESPKQSVTSPIEKGDHPETDTSELLDAKGIQMYQSLIGALQWIVTIGRFDINTAVMTLSGFRVAPRQGHLNRIKRIYGYLAKMRHASIRIRTEEPDYSDLADMHHDWSRSVYGELSEVVPHDCPEALGNFVTLTHYVDANLMHDIVTGRSVTGILHVINKTPIDWFSKKQATVETATYGSEFVAARICVEQIIDLRNTLRYLGVPIRGRSYMFGDNKSVVDSSSQVHAKLHKRHNMLSFHRVRESIASGMIGFYFIPGDINPADILSKHWGYGQVWIQLKALLFWKGNTEDIAEE